MYTHGKLNDLANAATDAAQANACMASAPKPAMRERMEVLQKLAEECRATADGIRYCLFGGGGEDCKKPEMEPDSLDAVVDWLGEKLEETLCILREVRERL